MPSVSEFAESIGYTTQAINAKIRQLKLELTTDPNDKRKRLLSEEQAELLRSKCPSKTGASTPDTTPVQSTHTHQYQRPEEIGLVLAERAIAVGDITYHHQNPTDNPVVQLLQARLQNRREANQLNLVKLQSFTHANTETNAAIDAIEQLEAIESGEAQADRLYFLQQEAMRRRTETLKLTQLQLQSPGRQSPAQPTATPQPQPGPRDMPF